MGHLHSRRVATGRPTGNPNPSPIRRTTGRPLHPGRSTEQRTGRVHGGRPLRPPQGGHSHRREPQPPTPPGRRFPGGAARPRVRPATPRSPDGPRRQNKRHNTPRSTHSHGRWCGPNGGSGSSRSGKSNKPPGDGDSHLGNTNPRRENHPPNAEPTEPAGACRPGSERGRSDAAGTVLHRSPRSPGANSRQPGSGLHGSGKPGLGSRLGHKPSRARRNAAHPPTKPRKTRGPVQKGKDHSRRPRRGKNPVGNRNSPARKPHTRARGSPGFNAT